MHGGQRGLVLAVVVGDKTIDYGSIDILNKSGIKTIDGTNSYFLWHLYMRKVCNTMKSYKHNIDRTDLFTKWNRCWVMKMTK